MKFRVKMTLCMLALLSLLFGAGGSLLISRSFQDSLEREKASAYAACRMAWGALQIVNGLDPYQDAEAMGRTLEQLDQNRNLWSFLRLETREAALYSTEGAALLNDPQDWPDPGTCQVFISVGNDGRRYLLLASAVEASGELLFLRTAHDITALYEMRQSQQQTYLWVFLVMALLCAGLSYVVSWVLTAPLEGLSRASRAIASGHFSSRVRVRSEDEIGAVSEDFNSMAEQLERHISQLHQAMERQEQFVGSFAHEMKTPMTSLIGYAELLRSGTLTPEEQAEAAGYLYSEGKRLESLSRKLLELLVLKNQDLELVAVSPAELIGALAERLRPLYRGIAITCVCEPGLCLLEPDLVWSLLLNLADNARKAMEDGGALQFRLDLLEDGCRIQVLDTGRGIPPQSLERLTEAFYRVDKARSREQGGFGLGLALCQEIVALHRGTIRFDNRPQGGAQVTVELRGGRP